MTKYRPKPDEAVRWWKNGDFPSECPPDFEGSVVRYFRHPHVPADEVCHDCGNTWHEHGWIDQDRDGITVCPGMWVVTNGLRYRALSAEEFEATYEVWG